MQTKPSAPVHGNHSKTGPCQSGEGRQRTTRKSPSRAQVRAHHNPPPAEDHPSPRLDYSKRRCRRVLAARVRLNTLTPLARPGPAHGFLLVCGRPLGREIPLIESSRSPCEEKQKPELKKGKTRRSSVIPAGRRKPDALMLKRDFSGPHSTLIEDRFCLPARAVHERCFQIIIVHQRCTLPASQF